MLQIYAPVRSSRLRTSDDSLPWGRSQSRKLSGFVGHARASGPWRRPLHRSSELAPVGLEAWFWCVTGTIVGTVSAPAPAGYQDYRSDSTTKAPFSLFMSQIRDFPFHTSQTGNARSLTTARLSRWLFAAWLSVDPSHTGSTPGRAQLQQEGTDPVHRPRLRAVAVPSRAVRPRPMGSRQSCSPSDRPWPASWLLVNCF